MTNGVLKRLAWAGMVGAGALFGAKEVRATPVELHSFTQVAGENDFGGQRVNYSSGSISFRDQADHLIQNNHSFSFVYFASLPEYDGIHMAVGGLDGSGRSAAGWFFGAGSNYGVGLNVGQTVNYPFADNGYWRMFVDVNGDRNFGTYDSDTGLFDFDEGEMISDISVSNSQGFQTGVGTISAGDISGWYTIPASSAGALKALGLSALALPSGTNVVHFQIAVTNLTSFRV